jgi:hypothetical protein
VERTVPVGWQIKRESGVVASARGGARNANELSPEANDAIASSVAFSNVNDLSPEANDAVNLTIALRNANDLSPESNDAIASTIAFSSSANDMSPEANDTVDLTIALRNANDMSPEANDAVASNMSPLSSADLNDSPKSPDLLEDSQAEMPVAVMSDNYLTRKYTTGNDLKRE